MIFERRIGMEKRLITAEDTIYDIVSRYPEIKKRLLELSPRYERLNNPVLFETVARFTTVQKAAQMVGIYLREMLYQLNDAIGLGEEYLQREKETNSPGIVLTTEQNTPPPSWWKRKETSPIMDVRDIPHPFNEIPSKASSLKKGEVLFVMQNFVPFPLLSYLASQGFESYYEKQENWYLIGFYRKEENNA